MVGLLWVCPCENSNRTIIFKKGGCQKGYPPFWGSRNVLKFRCKEIQSSDHFCNYAMGLMRLGRPTYTCSYARCLDPPMVVTVYEPSCHYCALTAPIIRSWVAKSIYEEVSSTVLGRVSAHEATGHCHDGRAGSLVCACIVNSNVAATANF